MSKKFILLLIVNLVSADIILSQQWAGALRLYEKHILAENYDSALYYAEESAAIARGVSGENNLQFCKLLRNLSTANYHLGRYRKAALFILKEVVTRELLKATNDNEYIVCLNAASVICRKAGDYEVALAQIKKAEKKALQVFGPSSAGYSRILESLAGVYFDYGFPDNDLVYIRQAENYLRQAGEIYGKLSGKEAEILVINNKANMAAWYNNTGNTPRAVALMKEVVGFYQKSAGTNGPAYGSALNNLGVIHFNSGNYRMAETCFIESLTALNSSNGTNDLHKAIFLCNLGALYHETGNFRNAEVVLKESGKHFSKMSFLESPRYSVVLNNLAAVYISGEYFEEPERKNPQNLIASDSLLKQAEMVFNLNCAKPHQFYNSILSNRAALYYVIGDKKKSAEFFKEFSYEANVWQGVVPLARKMSFSTNLHDSGININNHGIEPAVIPAGGDLDAQVSESYSRQELIVESESGAAMIALGRLVTGRAERLRKEVGDYHPSYATALRSLIHIYKTYDDVKREEELWLEYMRVMNHKILQDFSYMSESEKEMYYQTRLPEIHSFISYALLRKRFNPAISVQAYNNILLSKGLMLKSSAAMRSSILNSNNPDLLRRYDEWIAVKKEISALYATPLEMRSRNVSELEKEANSIERSLVAGSQDFNDYRRALQVTWEDVRKGLRPGEAAIEFTDFRRRERDGGNEAIYCAMIVRENSQYPEMVKLFTEGQLRALIDRPSYTPYIIGEIYGTDKKQDDKLYNLIWKPLEQYLDGVNTVYVSPAGLLNKVSFPAISNGKGIFLCDNYKINTKISTGLQSAPQVLADGTSPSAMVFGGINYTTGNAGSEVWSYLEGTKREGDIITRILESARYEVKYLSDNEATEAYFKNNANKYNILHLATHGFFFEDPNLKRFEEAQKAVDFGNIAFRGITRSFGVENFVNNENPLMRSGLVLAGANDVWADTINTNPEDGVLTAQEVAQIDMRKSSLVVLSACETGLGDIKGSEGVYGLQRALKIAGTRFIVMSLWEIPDRETVEFMTAFYNGILKTNDIRSSFHTARETLRAKYDPYYWAAFVLLE